MTTRRLLDGILLAVGCAVVVAVSPAGTGGGQTTGQSVSIDADDIGGVVTGPKGPEAGVWVIAETTDLPTKFSKIVVTDDRGRYLVPDLPESERTTCGCAATGSSIRQSADRAGQDGQPDGGGGAQRARGRRVLPGRLLVLAAPCSRQRRVPRHRSDRQRHLADHDEPGRVAAQSEVGRLAGRATSSARKATREIPPGLGTFPIIGGGVGAADAVRPGRRADERRPEPARSRARACDVRGLDRPDRRRRGAAGAAAAAGLERNVVITQWDWADPKAYLHDVVSTDRRNPTLNANGLIYGALELSADYLPVLDPVRHTTSQVPLTVRDPNTPPTPPAMPQPSPYLGSEVIWTSKNNVHNPMFDERGRVWITVRGAAARQPRLLQGRVEPSVGEAVPDSTMPAGTSRSTIRRRRSSRTSARASARTT